MAVRPRRYRETVLDKTVIKDSARSEWVLAISPKRVDGFIERRTDAHPNLRGYKITRPDLKKQLPNEVEHYACGIYEWKAIKTEEQSFVVYIGSTCRDPNKQGDFITRIMEYCRTGSHKAGLIEEALRKGYQLWVSFSGSYGGSDRNTNLDNQTNRSAAERDENDLLERYDYAWNIRNQREGIRKILD